MYFWRYLWKTLGFYSQQEGDWGWFWQNPSTPKLVTTSYLKRSSRIFWQIELHFSIYLTDISKMWSNIQIGQETWFKGMNRRMSDCFWQRKRLLIHPSNFGTVNSWETHHFVSDCPQEVNGLRIRSAWWDWKERACHLLLEQEIHRLWIQVPLNGKDVLCTSLDHSKTQAILALPYNMVDLQIGSH